MKYIFEIHYSSDGIHDIRVFYLGTFEGVANYHDELINRGEKDVRVIWKGSKA